MSNRFVVIVAGGVGSRMNNTLPKQFLLLGDQPVLMHTIEQFYATDPTFIITVVLAQDMVGYWKELCGKYGFHTPHHVVYGGATRFQSVRNGLAYLQDTYPDSLPDSLVAIHDGARPVIDRSLIESLFTAAGEKNAVIPAVQSLNSIRFGNKASSRSIDRSEVWQVQTPQVFRGDTLVRAYRQQEDANFTDDASVVEKMGNTIFIHQGDHLNIKITYPEDIDIAQLYLTKLKQS